MTNTRNEPMNTLEYIESLTVTLIRATNEHNKHNGKFFDKTYVEHNPKFYKLDANGRALFVKIVAELLKVDFYFSDSYTIKPLETTEDQSKIMPEEERNELLKQMLSDEELKDIGRYDLLDQKEHDELLKQMLSDEELNDQEKPLYRCEDCGDRVAKGQPCSCDDELESIPSDSDLLGW